MCILACSWRTHHTCTLTPTCSRATRSSRKEGFSHNGTFKTAFQACGQGIIEAERGVSCYFAQSRCRNSSQSWVTDRRRPDPANKRKQRGDRARQDQGLSVPRNLRRMGCHMALPDVSLTAAVWRASGFTSHACTVGQPAYGSSIDVERFQVRNGRIGDSHRCVLARVPQLPSFLAILGWALQMNN